MYVRKKAGETVTVGGKTHRSVYLVWIWVGGHSGWAVWQRRCICAHLVVRTMGEILRTRGHVDESSHPGRGEVNPFVLFKETWLGKDVCQLSDGVTVCAKAQLSSTFDSISRAEQQQ